MRASVSYFLSSVVASLVALPACSDNTNSSNSGASADSSVECRQPSNPWADANGGHDAGFRWAEENGLECPSDHGQSFEEGCNEYYDQLHRYKECEASKKR
jgi:hypothetical protein